MNKRLSNARAIVVLIYFLCVVNAIGVEAQSIQEKRTWKASWITSGQHQDTINTWTVFRKSFDMAENYGSAVLRIASDTKYWLWVNGRLVVFEGGLKRGPSPFDTYYDELELAPYLKIGKNTVAVLVWYLGKDGFSHKSSGRSGLIFDLQSSGLELLSDSSWKSVQVEAYKTASLPIPNFRLPESNILYDGRKDIGCWQSENYDDVWMLQAKVLGKAGDPPWNKLVVRPIPLLKDFGLKNYISQIQRNGTNSQDTIICELPYNAQITPYLKIEAPEGKRLTICTDNYLLYNGGADIIRAEYITRKGIQEYESLGWMNGHKVYYIIPQGVKVLELKYRESGYNTEFAGSFHCSSPFFNKLWAKANRTLYITMRDNYMDCPDRERAQWNGDAVNEAGESFYALSTSSHALTKKWLYELINWQREDGSLFAPVPAGNWNNELPCQALASIGYYGLWTYYLYTGDKQTIADLYDGAKSYMNIWESDGKGTMKYRKGDWTWGDWGDNRDILLIYNLWYYLAAKGMRNMAHELGKPTEETAYSAFMLKFKSSFNEQFWNGSAYRDPNYTGKTDDRTQALAVVSGIADREKYPSLLKIFQQEEHASPYMEKYVFEAMMQMGFETEAMERHQKRFNKMVNNPSFTTLFEGWGIGKEGFGGGTVNHAWSGGGLTILSQYVCGIAPVKPGFSEFQVMPQPGALKEASATIETVKGVITSSYKMLHSGFEINVTVPDSSTAIVGLPSSKVRRILLNGKLVWSDGNYLGVTRTDLKLGEERIYFDVKSGNWCFIAKF